MLWPMIWANTCCSHPQESETPVQAGQRRMKEELGFVCDLQEGPSYVYRAEDADRGVEHEYVTTLIGTVDMGGALEPDPKEVAEHRWVDVDQLQSEMAAEPEKFAPWFHLGLPQVLAAVRR